MFLEFHYCSLVTHMQATSVHHIHRLEILLFRLYDNLYFAGVLCVWLNILSCGNTFV
jgi:hypothetical protein